MRADDIKIECEEDGFHMIVDTDHDRFDFHIHAVAPELFEQVKRVIGSWLAEGEAVRGLPRSAVFACAPEDVDESGGYALDDPKHPTFHERYAEIHDNRAKGGRCI